MPESTALPRCFSSKEALEHFNRHLFVRAMREHGVTQVDVAYSGSGDDGGPDNISTVPPDAQFDVTLLIPDGQQSPGCISVKATEHKFQDVAAQIAMCYVSTAHEGWENDDGGKGILTLTLDQGVLTTRIEHTHIYTDFTEEMTL